MSLQVLLVISLLFAGARRAALAQATREGGRKGGPLGGWAKAGGVMWEKWVRLMARGVHNLDRAGEMDVDIKDMHGSTKPGDANATKEL